jgi:hypothetical protein
MADLNELKKKVVGLHLEDFYELVEEFWKDRGDQRYWGVVRFRNVASDPDGGVPAQFDYWHFSLRQAEGSAEAWRQDHPDDNIVVVQRVQEIPRRRGASD